MTGSAEEVFKRVKHPRNNTKFLRKVGQLLDNGTVVEVDTVNLSMDISSLELETFKILAAERLRLIKLGTRLIADYFQHTVNILKW